MALQTHLGQVPALVKAAKKHHLAKVDPSSQLPYCPKLKLIEVLKVTLLKNLPRLKLVGAAQLLLWAWKMRPIIP